MSYKCEQCAKYKPAEDVEFPSLANAIEHIVDVHPSRARSLLNRLVFVLGGGSADLIREGLKARE